MSRCSGFIHGGEGAACEKAQLVAFGVSQRTQRFSASGRVDLSHPAQCLFETGERCAVDGVEIRPVTKAPSPEREHRVGCVLIGEGDSNNEGEHMLYVPSRRRVGDFDNHATVL